MLFGSAVLARDYDEVLHSWGKASLSAVAPTVGTLRRCAQMNCSIDLFQAQLKWEEGWG